MGALATDVRRHDINRNVKYRNKEVEQTKDSKPNVATGINP